REAQAIGRYQSKDEVVIVALQEYIARRQVGKEQADSLQSWVEQLYGDQKPSNTVETLIAERRDEAAQS
ncbi:MAG: type II toxin-antitoxin system VapB family antitoxin, partial [Chloroflexota bacterium]